MQPGTHHDSPMSCCPEEACLHCNVSDKVRLLKVCIICSGTFHPHIIRAGQMLHQAAGLAGHICCFHNLKQTLFISGAEQCQTAEHQRTASHDRSGCSSTANLCSAATWQQQHCSTDSRHITASRQCKTPSVSIAVFKACLLSTVASCWPQWPS